MRCVILSLAVLSLAAVAGPALAATPDGHFNCGRDIVRTYEVHEITAEQLQVDRPVVGRRAATIVLNPGPTLAANAQALAAWNDAVDLWESVLGDNVTVTIDGDLAALPAGVLGSTGSSVWAAPYDDPLFNPDFRTLVIADADTDEGICASLPTAAQLSVDLPNVPAGFTYNGNISATRALLSALGVNMNGQVDPGGIDATITFSTGFLADFDFDPSNGIGAGKLDFFGIVAHELGHALGFTSNVDLADYYADQNQPIFFGPTVPDLFRLVPGAGAVNFTTATRILTHGGEVAAQTFYDGVTERRFSTGSFLGDGNQASHWRADEISGVTIGLMDPTLSYGQLGKLTNSDVRLLGISGWDVNYLPDCNDNDIGDQFDIWAGDETDVNENGVPDSCEATAAPSVQRATVVIAPNPFNPRTQVKLTLAADAHAKIAVYDLAGRHVDTLADRGFAAGVHSVIWEGKDSGGRGVSSGVYFVLVDIDGEVQRHKVALVR